MTTDTLEHHDHHHDADGTSIFGFWIYIMSDCILFATLFATFIVLHNNTFGGPSMKEIINIPYVFGETVFLLLSNFTFGMAILSLYRSKKRMVMRWLTITFFLGLAFVVMEVNEFIHLALEGHGWNHSGFLSGFFTLVGTHGLHVSIGLTWILVSIFQLFKFGVTPFMRRRLTYLGMFWNFLDIVWIFVFTIVYLMGAI